MKWNDIALLIVVVVMPFVALRYRQWMARISLTVVAGGFWGMMAAGLAGWILGIQEDARLLFVGLPVSIVVAVIFWRKAPKILESMQKTR